MTTASPSRLHRVDAVEIFHWYGGDEVEQVVVTTDGEVDVRRIGPAGPQAVVPTGAWQGLHVPEPGAWCLLGCTVAPGFEFDGFDLADEGTVHALAATHPEVEELLRLLA